MIQCHAFCAVGSLKGMLSIYKILKTDRTHPRDYPRKPPDYRHTDKVHGLVMVLLARNLHTASQALRSTTKR